jgi:hypothetical protein
MPSMIPPLVEQMFNNVSAYFSATQARKTINRYLQLNRQLPSGVDFGHVF